MHKHTEHWSCAHEAILNVGGGERNLGGWNMLVLKRTCHLHYHEDP